MNKRKMISVATVLSLGGGIWNLLVSVIRLPNAMAPWYLTSMSGFATIFAALLLYLDPHYRALWGGLIFFYSNLGFIPFGISYEGRLLPYGFATFILGIIGGALGIHESKARSSKTESD